MTESSRKLFHANKPHREESDLIKVLVSLKAPPDHLCLAGLEEIGLKVTSVNGNKLTGEIASKFLTKLEEHASVTEVERSVMLNPADEHD